MHPRLQKYLPIIAVLVLVVVVQLVITASGANYYLTQLTMSAYYSLVVLGLCLLMGYAGQISLGQAGFFAIGGYTSAVLTTMNLIPYADSAPVQTLARLGMVFERQDLYGNTLLSFSPWLAFIAALIMTVVIALIIGIPVIRLRGHYLAMATLGFGLIIYRIVLGTGFLGEADGITGVPPFPLFGTAVSGSLATRVPNYYIAWTLVLLGMLLALNLIQSRVGRALRSIHGSEEAAGAMGIDTARYKLATFVLSAVFAAVGGIFLTHYNGGIGPSEATGMKSIRYLAVVAVGGMDNLWGALLMSMLLNFLSLRGYFGTYDDAVFGAILLAIMLFFPDGLLRAPGFRNLQLLRQKLSALVRPSKSQDSGNG
ncbi:MAG: branched-chain amino acid ABC transporter permease [Spirochaetia bacterium]